MSRAQIAAAVLLGTFAFVLVIAGGASLAEAEERERKIRITDFDPSGFTTLLADSIRIIAYTAEWKKENRLALSLVWSGIACAIAAVVVACL